MMSCEVYLVFANICGVLLDLIFPKKSPPPHKGDFAGPNSDNVNIYG